MKHALKVKKLSDNWYVVDESTEDEQILYAADGLDDATRMKINMIEDEKKAYLDVLLSIEDAGMTVKFEEEFDISAEDAKLSAEKRKSLPDSAFCGPDRSFPAHDCAHVRAGFRLLNRAKASSSTKAKIRACLKRKNKSKSCGVNVGEDAEPVARVIQVKTTATRNHVHDAELDLGGNGVTSVHEPDGHQHKVVKFEVLQADGHTHELSR